MSNGPFWSETGLIMQKLSEADRVTLIQHQRKSEDAVRAEALDMGRRMEREAIVAWLRYSADECLAHARLSAEDLGQAMVDCGKFVIAHAACIERGEHEKGSG